jgi:hypothetical protein
VISYNYIFITDMNLLTGRHTSSSQSSHAHDAEAEISQFFWHKCEGADASVKEIGSQVVGGRRVPI